MGNRMRPSTRLKLTGMQFTFCRAHLFEHEPFRSRVQKTRGRSIGGGGPIDSGGGIGMSGEEVIALGR